MQDIIYKNNRPLKIVHGFPIPAGATLEECKKIAMNDNVGLICFYLTYKLPIELFFYDSITSL